MPVGALYLGDTTRSRFFDETSADARLYHSLEAAFKQPVYITSSTRDGKKVLVEDCMSCHGFQSKMAAVKRDLDGWRSRVEYMREAMRSSLADPARTLIGWPPTSGST